MFVSSNGVILGHRGPELLAASVAPRAAVMERLRRSREDIAHRVAATPIQNRDAVVDSFERLLHSWMVDLALGWLPPPRRAAFVEVISNFGFGEFLSAEELRALAIATLIDSFYGYVEDLTERTRTGSLGENVRDIHGRLVERWGGSPLSFVPVTDGSKTRTRIISGV